MDHKTFGQMCIDIHSISNPPGSAHHQITAWLILATKLARGELVLAVPKAEAPEE